MDSAFANFVRSWLQQSPEVQSGEAQENPATTAKPPAILSQPLTFDMAAVESAVSDLPFKKGFTNMAQAFSTAQVAFIQGSRRGAQSTVMVVTDGKPSFNFMTTQMVEQLDDKGIQRYFLVVSEEALDDAPYKMMKEWASQPWETNLVHVNGGLAVLDADTDLW